MTDSERKENRWRARLAGRGEGTEREKERGREGERERERERKRESERYKIKGRATRGLRRERKVLPDSTNGEHASLDYYFHKERVI